ncbi:MAG: hypothetical protein AB8G17_13885 [Gammaproteobacteria bacterium]
MSKSIPSDKNQRVRWTTATVVGAASWVVTTQLAGCGAAGKSGGEGGEGGEGAEGAGSVTSQSMSGGEGSGGEGSGGEGSGGEGPAAVGGGEGEGAQTAGANFAVDDAAYLTQLGLIRGHLAVGNALYQNDLAELAQTHIKHPRAEIYSVVAPAFAKRGCDDFADGLSALTAAVTANEDKARIAVLYATLTEQIARCEAKAATGDPQVMTKVIENLLRTAAVEYQVGIIDGAVNNLHEYQDAWGFTQVAADWASTAAYRNSASATAVGVRLQAIITGLDRLWPSLNPTGSVDGDAAQLFGAAGQVEVASLSLE